MRVRVRFAPSPTGPLHIGGARSALFNYLFARHHQGVLVVRVEDTDLERSRPEYEDEILASLDWLGLTWDEGLRVGGPHAPYRQTERLDTYRQCAEALLERGLAYPCFCSEEELEAERAGLIAKGETPRYLGTCRNLSEEERAARRQAGIVPTIRFRAPQDRLYVVEDLVRGRVAFEGNTIGDFIIMKSDGIPTYNFAVVVDDHLMEITHVIRAEEHLTNTPRQMMIYEAMGWEMPKFAHVSLILGEDRQKMSKRHGATSVIQYRQRGYLPEALVNFLALLGWAPEGQEELMTLEEMVRAFSLERVARNPAVFDLDKLNWMNQQYLKRKSTSELGMLLRPFLEEAGYGAQVAALGEARYRILVEGVRDYLVCLSDVGEYARPFLDPPRYDSEAAAVLTQEGVAEMLARCRVCLGALEGGLDEAQSLLKELPRLLGMPARQVYRPLRVALTGKTTGPELPFLVAVWGGQGTEERLQQAFAFLSARKA